MTYKDKPFEKKVLYAKKPEWLKVQMPIGEEYQKIKQMMRTNSLHTVCEEAHCPNIGECWGSGTATFLVLGDVCSRNCRFCAVTSGKPTLPDPMEPKNIAESVFKMHLAHTVITSVTRDDLPDGGAEHWRQIVIETRKLNPKTTIEVLIPDFMGKQEQYSIVFSADPDILNHNVETVPRLYPTVRPKANFNNSLRLLKDAKEYGLKTKTGFMVGLGETKEEVIDIMKQLRKNEVSILTIGQYLQPTKAHLAVSRYVTPAEFVEYKKIGLEMGFLHVESAPLVRSSYHAKDQV